MSWCRRLRPSRDALLFVAGSRTPRDSATSPRALAAAARTHLRQNSSTCGSDQRSELRRGRNGDRLIVESEGNGRMCLTLPRVFISVIGIEKVVPTWKIWKFFFSSCRGRARLSG